MDLLSRPTFKNIASSEEQMLAKQQSSTHQYSATHQASQIKGIAKGLVAVALFSLTVPMTKVALTGFSPEAIAAIRVFIAGLFSLFLIGKLSARIPTIKETVGLILAGLGICVGFPYGISLTLMHTSAIEMGVALAALPLLTAIIAVFISKERHNLGFWISVFAGFGLLAHYFSNGLSVDMPFALLVTLISSAFGYAIGGHVAKTLGGWQTICWMMIFYLPISAFSFGYYAPAGFQWNLEAALALVYLGLISQWLGFHFWYDGMAKAGIGRISQLQLLQPFMTLVFAAVILGEALLWSQLGYVLLIALIVFSALRFR